MSREDDYREIHHNIELELAKHLPPDQVERISQIVWEVMERDLKKIKRLPRNMRVEINNRLNSHKVHCRAGNPRFGLEPAGILNIIVIFFFDSSVEPLAQKHSEDPVEFVSFIRASMDYMWHISRYEEAIGTFLQRNPVVSVPGTIGNRGLAEQLQEGIERITHKIIEEVDREWENLAKQGIAMNLQLKNKIDHMQTQYNNKIAYTREKINLIGVMNNFYNQWVNSEQRTPAELIGAHIILKAYVESIEHVMISRFR
tara:strand:- start:17831 stop:18601 length:771 start_codon:yes stop_codon:yes gene_type:complete